MSLSIGCLCVFSLTITNCSNQLQSDVQQFIEDYTNQYVGLYYESSLAHWASNTKIVEGDTTNAARTRAADEALAAFTGSVENIEACRKFLEQKNSLTSLQVKQLEAILYAAADNPQTVPELVKKRIAAETEQTEKLFGFNFQIKNKDVSTNDIDKILNDETNLEKRLQAWQASKEVGIQLRDGLQKLQKYRNETVRALGYDDFFAYQVSDYKMTTSEMLGLMQKINRELRPLFTELHTYVRYELAERYNQPVPHLIPAHWLPNRWGQDWTGLMTVEGVDLDGALGKKSTEWLVEQAERFYISLGFEALPESFYTNSSLFPLPPDAEYKKNNHASAWHLDLKQDVRSLMSVQSNSYWYETVHHELGHIYYYISYTNPNVPVLLRGGANRGYHEAIGYLMGLAAMQPRFTAEVGLTSGESSGDPFQLAMKEALNYVVFMPWSTGVMTEFEYELYAKELPADQWNKRWWELKAKHQGIAPPSMRVESYCDPATKTHINNDAGQYYDYALSYLISFQLHDHIARNILNEDPHDTNYYGQKKVGDFLKTILEPGATANWRKLMKEKTGEGLSARAMLVYFEPLMEQLKEKNKGRKHSLIEL